MRFRCELEGTSPVVGVLFLVALTLILAGILAGTIGGGIPLERAPTASVSMDEVDSSENRIVLIHDGGDSIDVSEIEILTYVNGEPLEKQLRSLPAFGAPGYLWPPNPGPIFKGTSDHTWEVGETSSYRIASTNSPSGFDSSDSVTVKIVHRPSGSLISEYSSTAR